jgi:peptidoglycan/xylan/chitin deacetylase (PgdA/CDA1 family)
MRRGSLPPSLAAITIDDGFRDAYEVAFPLLVRNGVPATVFVVTDFLDQKAWIWTDKARFLTCKTSIVELETSIASRNLKFNLNGPASRSAAAARFNEILKGLDDNEKEEAIINIASALKVTIPDMPPAEYGALSWDQAREMDKAGVEIASHTLTHPILTNVSDERLRVELEGSRSRVEDMLGHESSTFCYPNGNYDARIVREVEQAGYACAVSTEQGLNSRTSDQFSLQRFPALANFPRFVKTTSGFELAQTKVLFRDKLVRE